MPLHIVQLGPYPPPEGGISRNMLAIRDEALKRRHRCSIIATAQSGNAGGGPNVHHPRSALALIRLLALLKYDVLHLHVGGDVTARVLALASACAFFGRQKNVLSLHSGAYPLTDEAKNASQNSVRGLIFRRFARLIAVNDAIADVFRRYGARADRISVIQPYSLRRPDDSVAIPAELDEFWAKHSPLLLAVGGLEKDYDPLLQIDAMKDIINEFPRAGVMIVGDGSMRSEVEKAVASSGYAHHISLAGNVDHAVTLHLINDADVLLRTTLFDGDAISVREALFLDTPVIATDTGTRPEGVHLIGIGDKNALVEKVKQVIGAGRSNAATQTPDDLNISAVVDLYEELAGSVQA